MTTRTRTGSGHHGWRRALPSLIAFLAPAVPPAFTLAVPAAVTLAGAMAFAQSAEAQSITAAQVEAVDAAFQAWNDPAGPGAAVAVTWNGRIVYSQGYGSAQLEYRIPVTPTTPFHVASVSKQFTTFAVALLARDGLLSWDDEVHRHLPALPEFGRPVTLRQLAQHTSGIRDQWELLIQAGWRIDDVITRDQILALMARQRELNFEPGSEYLYSNMGYSLLAEVVEQVAGEPFGTFLRERVFLPLGMHRTHVHNDHTRIVPGRAYSYAPTPEQGWRNAVLSYANQGATSLFTTAEDLGRWMTEMESPMVGDEVLWAEMTEPARLNGGDTAPYGLGLSVGSYRGLRTIGHGGADAGFRTNLLFFPDEGMGVVVFGNASSFNAGGLAREVARVFLEDRLEPVEAEEATAATTGAVPVGPVEVPRSALDELAGLYRLPTGALIAVSARDGGLVAEVDEETRFPLTPISETTFRVESAEGTSEGSEGRATFSRDGDGRVQGMTVALSDATLQGRRVEVASLPAEVMAQYEGSFYSPELDVVYRIRVREDELVVERPRQPEESLFVFDRDRFGSSQWGMNTVEFARDAEGRVVQMLVSGGRVRNVRFHRVDPWEM